MCTVPQTMKDIMLKKEARLITGGLSKTSKKPGPAYKPPGVAWIKGAQLGEGPGTGC